MRNLLKGLAAEGRTVFVSSHLISEIALTADRLVIIGRGPLIAETTVAQLIASSKGRFVRVRTPAGHDLARPLTSPGARVRRTLGPARSPAATAPHAPSPATPPPPPPLSLAP